MEPSPGPSKVNSASLLEPLVISNVHTPTHTSALASVTATSTMDTATTEFKKLPTSLGITGSPSLPQDMSQRGQLEHDTLMLSRAVKTGVFSPGMLQWMGLWIRMRDADMTNAALSTEDCVQLDKAQQTPIELPPITHIMVRKHMPRVMQKSDERKRQRSRSLSLTPPSAGRMRRESPPAPEKPIHTVASTAPKPQRPRSARPTAPTFAEATKREAAGAHIYVPPRGGGATPLAPPPNDSASGSRPLPTDIPRAKQFAQGTQPGPSTARPTPPATNPPAQKVAGEKKERYPPLVVEKLSNWTAHFKNIASILKRPPNGRPYGQGIRFSPEDEIEYRVVQRYLSELEKKENISWFSYSLPAERSFKVAIRGLPEETPTEEIIAALEEKGFEPEYVKAIKGRQGRPGCVYYAQLKKTPNITPAIYELDELLLMPGVKIEAWRAKKGPAQCHKCQTFRHSSAQCHRLQACVRCGEPHAARECPRPLDVPATCANCGGPHPANYAACPVYKKEWRNKTAGTIALSKPERKGAAPVEIHTVDETAAASLMAPANSQKRGGARRGRRKRPQQQQQPPPEKKPEAPTGTARVKPAVESDRRDSLGQTIGVLKEILEAVQAGTDAETATLTGLMRLLTTKNG